MTSLLNSPAAARARRTTIAIPTLNAAGHLDQLLPALSRQAGFSPSNVLVIDSSSDDDTRTRFESWGAQVETIARKDFNHGGTRRAATVIRGASDFFIYLTQDAIPVDDDSLLRLISAFDDESVGMAYGRQMPRNVARAIERHARLMNYPPVRQVRRWDDRHALGVKTVFCSDSFSAYRRTALEKAGNFPQDAFFAEDQIVAGRMVMDGWAIAYEADAKVVHSHAYAVAEEFRRYFDVGVFHARNPWLTESFGAAEGEGVRFLLSELRYLARHEPASIPGAAVRTGAKYLGYRLGRMETRLSARMKERLSMQPFYWRKS